MRCVIIECISLEYQASNSAYQSSPTPMYHHYRRQCERQRAWDMLGDGYLAVHHQWAAHTDDVERYDNNHDNDDGSIMMIMLGIIL